MSKFPIQYSTRLPTGISPTEKMQQPVSTGMVEMGRAISGLGGDITEAALRIDARRNEIKDTSASITASGLRKKAEIEQETFMGNNPNNPETWGKNWEQLYKQTAQALSKVDMSERYRGIAGTQLESWNEVQGAVNLRYTASREEAMLKDASMKDVFSAVSSNDPEEIGRSIAAFHIAYKGTKKEDADKILSDTISKGKKQLLENQEGKALAVIMGMDKRKANETLQKSGLPPESVKKVFGQYETQTAVEGATAREKAATTQRMTYETVYKELRDGTLTAMSTVLLGLPLNEDGEPKEQDKILGWMKKDAVKGEPKVDYEIFIEAFDEVLESLTGRGEIPQKVKQNLVELRWDSRDISNKEYDFLLNVLESDLPKGVVQTIITSQKNIASQIGGAWRSDADEKQIAGFNEALMEYVAGIKDIEKLSPEELQVRIISLGTQYMTGKLANTKQERISELKAKADKISASGGSEEELKKIYDELEKLGVIK